MTKYIIAGFLFVLIFSCTSYDKIYRESDLSKAVLSGKIITEEGLPLEGVKIRLNNSRESRSDINGKFFFSYLIYGEYVMTFEKEGYSFEEYSFKYDLKNKKIPFIKAKLMSLNYLLNDGIELLTQKRYSDVEKVIEKLYKINPDESSILYFKSTYLFERKKYKEALDIAERLIETDRKNIYYNLLLIEIYENLGWFRKKTEACIFVARNNPKEYCYLMKMAADIFKDKLEDIESSKKLMEEYEEMSKKR